MKIKIDKYIIELINELNYSLKAVDEWFAYEHLYNSEEDFVPTTKIGIKIYKEGDIISSAIVMSAGGGSGIHKFSQTVSANNITICCSYSVFKLSIPELTLMWQIQADAVTCFQIFEYENDHIIHGELNITRISNSGEILWQKSGVDIFTTENGEDVFELNDKFIEVKDWSNKLYKFGYNGERIYE